MTRNNKNIKTTKTNAKDINIDKEVDDNIIPKKSKGKYHSKFSGSKMSKTTNTDDSSDDDNNNINNNNSGKKRKLTIIQTINNKNGIELKKFEEETGKYEDEDEINIKDIKNRMEVMFLDKKIQFVYMICGNTGSTYGLDFDDIQRRKMKIKEKLTSLSDFNKKEEELEVRDTEIHNKIILSEIAENKYKNQFGGNDLIGEDVINVKEIQKQILTNKLKEQKKINKQKKHLEKNLEKLEDMSRITLSDTFIMPPIIYSCTLNTINMINIIRRDKKLREMEFIDWLNSEKYFVPFTTLVSYNILYQNNLIAARYNPEKNKAILAGQINLFQGYLGSVSIPKRHNKY